MDLWSRKSGGHSPPEAMGYFTFKSVKWWNLQNLCIGMGNTTYAKFHSTVYHENNYHNIQYYHGIIWGLKLLITWSAIIFTGIANWVFYVTDKSYDYMALTIIYHGL